MYVRVTPYRYNASREQEVVQFTEQQLVPAFRRLPGFRRYTGALDRDTGRGVAITEWDDQQHAQGFRVALGPLLQGIADVGIQLDDAQLYEIVVQV
jgi:hypothetical protein